jgi:hypothetical protein
MVIVIIPPVDAFSAKGLAFCAEVCDGSTDWTQAHDLSAEQRDRLHELQRLS